jgi:hypothetical protein
MATGTTLANLRQMLKAEVGDALTGVAPAVDALYNQLLHNRQQWLAAQFDWPVLRITRDVNFAANTRYGLLPTDLDQRRPIQASVLWQQYWYPLEDYGIETYLMNYEDSDNNYVADPVRRWQIIITTVLPVLEVWPVPQTAQTLRLTQQKIPRALAQNTDTAELDDLLIVLFTAAEIQTRRKQGDAQAKLAQAQAYFNKCKASAPSRDSVFILGGGLSRKRMPYGVTSTTSAGGTGGGGASGANPIVRYIDVGPNEEGLTPTDRNQPALAYRKTGDGPIFCWIVEEQLWR